MTAADDKKREERDALAAELALGALSGEERRDAERLAASNTGFARMVAAWHERLLPLADSYGLASPPAALKRQVESRLFGLPAEAEPVRGWWNSLALWRPLAIAASLAVVVLAGIQFYGPSRVAGPPLVAALAPEGGPVRYLAYFNEKASQLTLQRIASAPAQGRDHELWLVAGGNAPVPLGLLGRDESAAIAIRPDLAVELVAGAVLAVSDEPLGGSPTGVPTGPVIAAGPIRSF